VISVPRDFNFDVTGFPVIVPIGRGIGELVVVCAGIGNFREKALYVVVVVKGTPPVSSAIESSSK
jgi:hypothetical protein